MFWGDGLPELVFLHDAGESGRAWDAVALAAGRASVAIDLPGHGRSDWILGAVSTRARNVVGDDGLARGASQIRIVVSLNRIGQDLESTARRRRAARIPVCSTTLRTASLTRCGRADFARSRRSALDGRRDGARESPARAAAGPERTGR